MSRTIQCPRCKGVFIWDEGSPVARCARCGTEYSMHPRRGQGNSVLMPPVGRGQVDLLTVPGDSTVRNRPLLKCYIPNGWKYSCSLAGDRFDLVSNPFVVSVSFTSPDESARIVFTGESFYKHIDPTPQTAMLQNRLDDFTVNRSPSFFRLRTFMSAPDYCNMIAESSSAKQLRLIYEKQPDRTETDNQQNIIKSFLSKGFSDAQADFAGRGYIGYRPDGKQIKIYAQTRVVRLLRISTVPSVQMVPMPSVFGVRMTPQMINQQRQEIFWDTMYEFALIALSPNYERAYSELERIQSSIGRAPEYDQVYADAMALINNAQLSIAQARSASFERQSQIISDTNAYTSGIQRQMIADNAASHDRVARRNSEMIREVNSYQTSDGFVEASTRFDHVYQNRRAPELFAAQEGNSFEFGVDFTELRRNN